MPEVIQAELDGKTDFELEAIKQKGCFYLTKPFEIENVISLINKILGK